MGDRLNLNRFVEAQNPIYERVCSELRQGRKTSHWMWFVFPQIAGLGVSEMSRRFSISSLTEARGYLDHPILGPRLEECSRLVCAIEGKTIRDILGFPDDMKFRSCMTLFSCAAERPGIFEKALEKYFSGEPDALTLERIRDLGDPGAGRKSVGP
jgi:uncharacterized protein (DUF1810 family)